MPDFYRLDGILLPPEQCGASGCGAWFVQFIQGDAALTNLPGPAGSFALDNVFVRSSFPQNVAIPFGVS